MLAIYPDELACFRTRYGNQAIAAEKRRTSVEKRVDIDFQIEFETFLQSLVPFYEGRGSCVVCVHRWQNPHQCVHSFG